MKEIPEVPTYPLYKDAKFPVSQDLQQLFKKNVEFLPPEVAKYFGVQNRVDK